MSTEFYIQKNQSGEYHIFDDDNQQYWGPFFNLSDAQEILAQIEPRRCAVGNTNRAARRAQEAQ